MKLNKKISAFIATLALTAFGAFSMAGTANAAGESAAVDFKLDPRSGTFFKQAYRPGRLSIETRIETAAPTVLPMKNANLSLPASGSLTFNPGKQKVCADTQIGPPPTNVSITVPEAIDRCPDSIIGNGTAKFALAQSTALPRDGAIVLFNGGKQASGPLKGQPRVKLYAYSYDTGVGLYAEAALAKDGSLDFAIPQLTADSSVTSINLNLPGVVTPFFVASQDLTVNLPAGQNSNYVQAKCSTGSYPFSGEFLLGTRDTLGQPTSPTTTLNASTSYNCVGAAGKGRISRVAVKGPARVRKGKAVVYRVSITNNGTANASNVRLRATGRGVKLNAPVGRVNPGQTRTVRLRVRFNRPGKVRAQFKAVSSNAGSKTTRKVVRVRR